MALCVCVFVFAFIYFLKRVSAENGLTSRRCAAVSSKMIKAGVARLSSAKIRHRQRDAKVKHSGVWGWGSAAASPKEGPLQSETKLGAAQSGYVGVLS